MITAATQTLLVQMRTHLPASALPLWDTAQAWLAAHAVLVSVVGGLSVLLSVAGLALTPFVIARLPADFFLRLTRPPAPVMRRPHPARVIGRNVFGLLLAVLGVLLVPLPGPGALVALLGLALLDFPGKRRFLTAVLRRPMVWGSIGWLRRRAGRGPMLTPGRFVPRNPPVANRAVAADVGPGDCC